MAFFGGHDTEDINVTLENSAIYESEVGLGVIALECTQFEAEIFEECVKSDMKEYQVVQEGGDVEAFQESAWETVKTKVVNFVKKVWAKVKAFFNGWYAKIAARLMSDNKAFYNKFKKDVESKDLNNLKVKWEEPTKKEFKSKEFGQLNTSKLAEADLGEVLEEVYEIGEKVKTHAEAKSQMLKAAFEEEKEEDYNSVKGDVVAELTGANSVKAAQKAFKTADGKLSKTVAELTKENNETKNISLIANAVAKAQVTILEAQVSIAKKTASQARRVFAKAVAYSPKTESVELLEVEADAIATLG